MLRVLPPLTVAKFGKWQETGRCLVDSELMDCSHCRSRRREGQSKSSASCVIFELSRLFSPAGVKVDKGSYSMIHCADEFDAPKFPCFRHATLRSCEALVAKIPKGKTRRR